VTATPPDPAAQSTTWSVGTIEELEVHERLAKLRIAVEDRIEALPGQHYVVRLRAEQEDGTDYTAQRSYSVASDPADPLVELMVERLDGGEVSGFLHDGGRVGGRLEVRGPIGGWFTWTGEQTAVAVAGGTGVVPIVSMLRYAARLGLQDRLRVVAVGRTWRELPYAEELEAAGAFVALTRENRAGRVAAPPYLEEVRELLGGVDRAYVCGSVGFASFASRLLAEAGVRADAVRLEQFGATG